MEEVFNKIFEYCLLIRQGALYECKCLAGLMVNKVFISVLKIRYKPFIRTPSAVKKSFCIIHSHVK